MAAMDADTIRQWVSKAEQELAELTSQAEDLQRRIAQGRVQLTLMYELLASLTNEPVLSRLDGPGQEKSVRERVVESVVRILRDRGEPMRIQDVHAEFLRRQFALPGSGTPTNIAAHLVDRTVFTRPSRGVFGLAEWEPIEPAPVTRRRPSNRRKSPK